MPYNFFNEFKKACLETPLDVIPIGKTLKDASEIFNLRTKSELLSFIANNGLEKLTFINKKSWEKNPNPNHDIDVYAYYFSTRAIAGYVAFMFNEKTQKWLIKSFHHPKDRNTLMQDVLQKALALKKEKSDE